jgi:MFS family permease
VRLLMGVSFLQLGFLSWGFYAWQPYFLRLLGHDAVWVAGVVAAAMALSTIVGNAVVDWFSQFCGRRTTLLLWAAGVQTVAAIGVGLAGSFWLAVIFFLFVTVAVGVTGPVKQAYIHEMVPSGQRASVISFDSMMGNAGGVLGQSGLGYLSRARSIEEGYVAGGIATVLVFPLLIFLRSLGERTDIIVGKRAGRRATCAAQGLPQVAQVDAIAREAAG